MGSGDATTKPSRIVVMANASGCGKTTLGRELAGRMGAVFVELDALVHGPGWAETPNEALRAALAPILARERWVIDGNYRRKLGDLVLARADLVVWLDLPPSVWLPRLVRRTVRRAVTGEELWNGNRESLRAAVWGKDSLFGYALRTHRRRREDLGRMLARYPHVRLASPREVERFLAGF
jgi:adenylate kinase family enzyme